MPAILDRLLRLLLTNPICLRLVYGGSRRLRHLYIRAGYLGLMMVILLFALISRGNTLRQLAQSGANAFQLISFAQVGLICLLTPVFMAGAIAQEANPRTWDILLTTPLNGLQIVLGNLFGRLFFILALLFSTLPLFAVTQFFGGVPSESIFTSYAIAATSSLLVASIAVTLSVTRTAGKRAVFVFYIAVVMYLVVTYAIDALLRPVVPAGTPTSTTVMTPLNPFLALQALLYTNSYRVPDIGPAEAGWVVRQWMGHPISTFCWLCGLISAGLIIFSTARLRVIGTRVGTVPWWKKLLGAANRRAVGREPRRVGHNPIAWRESKSKGNTIGAVISRWTFVALGVLVAIVFVTLYHTGQMDHATFRLAILSTVGAELLIIVLTAINLSATAVSKEREDGSLDIILTTPIQPGPYLYGKLLGLVQYLLPMMLVPVITMTIIAFYVLADGMGRSGGVMVFDALAGRTESRTLPVVLPEGAIALPLALVPFVAFCVMIGLSASIRSKGTISSIIVAVGWILLIACVLGACGWPSGRQFPLLGALISAVSPFNLLGALIYPADVIPESLTEPITGRIWLAVGSAVAAGGFSAAVYAMHTGMKRNFMMTVRRLAGIK